MTAHDGRIRQDLDGAECRRLLATASIGRIGFTRGALPAIAPVPFLLRDQELVLIPVDRDDPIVDAVQGAVVVFEVDSYRDVPGAGWCVTVVGPSTVVPSSTASLTGTAARWGGDPGHDLWIRIALDRVSGWSRTALAHQSAVSGAGRTVPLHPATP